MTPHTKDFYCAKMFDHLVNKAVLDIYPPGEGAGKISLQLSERRRGEKRILPQNFNQFFGS